MVLDDASPQAGAYDGVSFGGNGEHMDMEDGSLAMNRFRITADNFVRPDPFTLYFGFFGKTPWLQRCTARLQAQERKVKVLVDRPPTQSEMEAFATVTSRSLYYSKAGTPLGLTAGLAHVYYSLRKFDPGRSGGIRTLTAAAANVLRAEPQVALAVVASSAVKLFLWTIGLTTVTSGFAAFSETKDVLMDPRLSGFVEDLKRQNPEDVQKRKLAMVHERHRQIQQRREQQQLPQGGAYAESRERDDGSYGRSDDDTFNATQFSPQGQTPDQPRAMPDTIGKPHVYGNPRTIESPTGSKNLDFFDDDDASPTAPEYRNEGIWSRPNSSASQGSAWERIRQQNGITRRSVQEDFRGPSPSPLSDRSQTSYEFGKRQEREQAQADFDRLLEAERNRSDTSGTGGWGQ